jgi:membrane protein
MFSVAPLLVIAIAVVGVVFGKQAAQSGIMQEIGGVLGNSGVQAVQTMLQSAHKPGRGVLAGMFGVIALLLGASGVFGELQDALKAIWHVPSTQAGLWQKLKNRFISYGMVLGVGFLLLVSLLLSAGMAAAGKFFGGFLPFSEVILHLLTFAVSFAVVTVLFALIFKVLPEVPVAWSDVWAGAVFTALLFEVGKEALGLYLGKSSMASAYGAASSVVVMMAWVYYSAQILYFGAEFTRAYAIKRGYRTPTAAGKAVTHQSKLRVN